MGLIDSERRMRYSFVRENARRMLTIFEFILFYAQNVENWITKEKITEILDLTLILIVDWIFTGYSGHIPYGYAHFGATNATSTNSALCDFTSNYRRRQSTEWAPVTISRPDPPLHIQPTEIYHKHVGMIPNYLGHVPGGSFRFVLTYFRISPRHWSYSYRFLFLDSVKPSGQIPEMRSDGWGEIFQIDTEESFCRFLAEDQRWSGSRNCWKSSRLLQFYYSITNGFLFLVFTTKISFWNCSTSLYKIYII